MGKEDHYSNKGGQWARGEADKVRREVERRFPETPFMRSEMFDARRSMRRTPQSGRRKPKQP